MRIWKRFINSDRRVETRYRARKEKGEDNYGESKEQGLQRAESLIDREREKEKEKTRDGPFERRRDIQTTKREREREKRKKDNKMRHARLIGEGLLRFL